MVRPSPHRPRGQRRSHVLVNGLRTRVEVVGDGPPLLLINGLWGEVRVWRHLLAHLTGFQTIAFDAPGIGDTEVPSYPMSLPGLGRFAAGVLDAVGVTSAHVLGVSFGGLVAQQLATLVPHRVDRLVLVSTSSGLVHVPGEPEALLALMTAYGTDLGDAAAGRVYGGRIRREPALLNTIGLRAPTSIGRYLHRISGLAGWWAHPWTIRQPTLIITGDDDPIVPASNSRILASLTPRSRLHVVAGGGHLLLFDSPAEMAPMIGGFLDGGTPRWVDTLAS